MVARSTRDGVVTRLRTPAGVDRSDRRFFVDARAGGLRRRGKPERIVERMDVNRAGNGSAWK